MPPKPPATKRQTTKRQPRQAAQFQKLDWSRFNYLPLWIIAGIILGVVIPNLMIDLLDDLSFSIPIEQFIKTTIGKIVLLIIFVGLWLFVRQRFRGFRQWSSLPIRAKAHQLLIRTQLIGKRIIQYSLTATRYSMNRLLAGNSFAWVGLVIILMWLPINPFSPFINFGEGIIGVPTLMRPGAYRNSTIAPLFTDEVDYWGGTIQHWAEEYNVDPNLLATVMQIESCGYPYATSHAGAKGLFQVMPFHFESGENQYDPDTNARRASLFLKECLTWSNNDVGLALACYNGGPSVVNRNFDTWAGETQRYYVWGKGIYHDASLDKQSSNTLNDWLAAGGSGLCYSAQIAED